MSLLDLNTKITGPHGTGGTSGSPNGTASVDQPETIDGLALDTLATGAVSLSPTVQSGAGGSGYSWIGSSNGSAGGNGGDAGAGILTLSNDTIGSTSAYDPNNFAYYSTAEGGYGGNGGLGANGGGAGGSGGGGGGATNIVSNLSAYLADSSANNGADMYVLSIAGPGGGGSSGDEGNSGGVGGNGGAGGNAVSSLYVSTIVSSDTIFGISVSATGAAGGAAGPGGDGGRGGDAAVSMIGDSLSVAGNLSVSLVARTGLGGSGGGSPGLNGVAGAALLDIESTTLSVAAGRFNALTFTLLESQGPSAPQSLNGGALGNLVFSNNHFIGSGASELDLAVANGGVAIDTVAGTIAIGGSPADNTLSGFNTYRLDSNDSIVMSAGVKVYLSTDPDTVILESGHVGGTVYNATSADFILQFQGFSGLTLAQVQQDAQVVGSNTQITIGGQTLTLTNYTGPINAANTEIVACFLEGTRIATDRGEITVENLRIGDCALTADGARRPIAWIGFRAVSARFANPTRCWPIRVKAGALDENVPSRDLLLSPDHALLVEDVLIQAGALVNGTSIVRETRVADVFVYYHVELDDHSLILAENTPAETFVDNVDRLGFDNWAEHEALFPGGKPIVEMAYPRAKAHRQVPVRIRLALAERAIRIGAADVAQVA